MQNMTSKVHQYKILILKKMHHHLDLPCNNIFENHLTKTNTDQYPNKL